MSTKSNESQDNWHPRHWILPPGFERCFQKFDIRCELIIANYQNKKSQPLLIHGQTGTGKSMFTEYFIHKFRKITNKKNITYLNCAAIPSELLESELFGFEKGAHNTATYPKAGYLEIAGDGVIVFEEVGEMARHLQAKLLMAIETKRYCRLGSTTSLEFKAQIIATTNAEQRAFREDFWFRFDIFSVPAIHERRCDILYYMEHFDPDLMRYLTRGVVFSALTYNWPGNVREIERVCFSIRENILNIKKHERVEDVYLEKNFPEYSFNRLSAIMNIDRKVSGFRFDKSQQFANDMLKENINVDTIDSYLQKSKLSLDCFNPTFLSDLKKENSTTSSAEGGVTSCFFHRLCNGDYIDTFWGLMQFCNFFFQDIESKYDILDFKSTVKYEEVKNNNPLKTFTCSEKYIQKFDYKPTQPKHRPSDFDPFGFFDKRAYKQPYYIHYAELTKRLQRDKIEPGEDERLEEWKATILESLKFLTKLKNIDENVITDLYGFYQKNPTNRFLSNYFGGQNQVEKVEEVPIENITLDDLKDLYYETVCHAIGTSHGFKKKIAELANRTPSLITQDFEKRNLNEKFSKFNFTPRKRILIIK